MNLNILWFRRDLRITDNKALANCVKEGKDILPIYIIENELLEEGVLFQPRTQFLLSALKRLADKMVQVHSKLFVFRGDPLRVIPQICSQRVVEGLFFNRNYEPKEIERDREIWQYCQNNGVRVRSYKDQVLHERGEILKKDKTPYRVFSFYYKQWKSVVKDNSEEIKPFKTVDFEEFQLNSIPDSKAEYVLEPMKDLTKFLKHEITHYDKNRDYPYLEGTSKLSAYLSTGMLSIRQLYHEAKQLLEVSDSKQRQGIETFIKQLSWRDFYYQILYHFPYVENSSFIEKFRNLKWVNDKEVFSQWCKGKTGVPIVDAGIRQLNQKGWMHNRLRMITASFLTKDLLIDWRWGECYFKEKLIDYDLPLNNGGWQWCASTGTDSQPYFRIFNPYTQSKKFDPDGKFIKRYIPELKDVKKIYIHQPDKMPQKDQFASNCILGKHYPLPIVDHAKQRKKALEVYKNP